MCHGVFLSGVLFRGNEEKVEPSSMKLSEEKIVERKREKLLFSTYHYLTRKFEFQSFFNKENESLLF